MLGRTLDRYRIESKIGEGGMGVVYRIHDMRLDRTVAIKVLSPWSSAVEAAAGVEGALKKTMESAQASVR